MIRTKNPTLSLKDFGRYYLKRSEAVLAWHFLPADGKTRFNHNGRGRIAVHAGKKLVVDGSIAACARGLHASINPLDALRFASEFDGQIICRVACWGEVESAGEKLAASHRAILWMADAREAIYRSALVLAETALDEHVPNPEYEFRRAIYSCRKYLSGLRLARQAVRTNADAWCAAEKCERGADKQTAKAARWATVYATDIASGAAYTAGLTISRVALAAVEAAHPAGVDTDWDGRLETELKAKAAYAKSLSSALMALAPKGYSE